MRSRHSGRAKKTGGRATSAQARVQSFLQLFNQNDNVLILINPDPDSMASALQRLENQAMMELLKIPMVRINQVDLSYFNRHVLVDSQPHHYEALGRFRYDAIIDHHPLLQEWDADYVDIRPEYGATATILVEYLRGVGVKPSMKIEWSELRLDDLRYFSTALQKMSTSKKGIYAHLGEVESPDICVQIADFFMRVHSTGWSFVSGIYRGKLVVILRSDGLRKDAGGLARRAFGSFGNAGGHRGAARAEILLDALREKGVEIQDADLQRFVRNSLDI
jgi:nanoRNase/pAp phosphatase (c-di-AMP/oligoRNAs hydrolase)